MSETTKIDWSTYTMLEKIGFFGSIPFCIAVIVFFVLKFRFNFEPGFFIGCICMSITDCLMALFIWNRNRARAILQLVAAILFLVVAFVLPV